MLLRAKILHLGGEREQLCSSGLKSDRLGRGDAYRSFALPSQSFLLLLFFLWLALCLVLFLWYKSLLAPSSV